MRGVVRWCSAVARHGHDMAMRRLDLAVAPDATWTGAGQRHASVSACGFHTSGFGLSYRGDLHRYDHPMLMLQSSASASATSLGPRPVNEGRAS